jgi:sulfide dehydrogenase [flavocytochrome c] flavoprotein subunit
MDGWKKYYPGMIEWISGDEIGRIDRVDTGKMEIFSSKGKSFKGSVINIIPPQQANTIAAKAGLTDNTGWCPITHRTFESSKHKDVYVLGDACTAGDMPKTAHSASAQAKVCAAAIVSKVQGTEMPEPVYGSSTYSLVAPKYGFSLASVFRLKDNRITFVKTGESPRKAPKKVRIKEAKYALGWYMAVTADAFASY